MTKVCPIMSRPVSIIEEGRDGTPLLTNDFYQVNCLEHKCALWNELPILPGDKPQGFCSLRYEI